MAQEPRQLVPRDMTNKELCHAWEIMNDHASLSPDDQAIIDEMERRHIEY